MIIKKKLYFIFGYLNSYSERKNYTSYHLKLSICPLGYREGCPIARFHGCSVGFCSSQTHNFGGICRIIHKGDAL